MNSLYTFRLFASGTLYIGESTESIRKAMEDAYRQYREMTREMLYA